MKQAQTTARARKTPPADLRARFKRIPEADRGVFDRQTQGCENKLTPELRDRWHRLAQAMMALAPLPPRAIGSDTMIFYVADGRYRKQVFALHARKDGNIIVCATNVLDSAVRAGIVRRGTGGDGTNHYRISDGDFLTIDTFDGKTPNPEVFYKDMTGWNRKAMCVTLSPSATPSQVDAAESLCVLSADWVAAE